MGWQIAIDGPAASGKSTISKLLANKLGFQYLDTGAMYRAVTLKALNSKINLENEEEYNFLETTTIEFIDNKIHLDGVDVSKEIRTLEVTNNASLVAKFGYVRSKLVAMQQKLAESQNIIVDGRDIGTVVLPNANLKIFLTASVRVRAIRRMKENETRGITLTLEETEKDIEVRDYKDSHREIGPLTQADDAVLVDTSDLSVEEVIETITRLVFERGYSMEDLTKNVNVEETKEAEKANEEIENVEETVEEVLEETAEEKATGYKEMQVVKGKIVEVLQAQAEKVVDGKVVKKAKEERVLIELEDGQEGFLFKKDCANVSKEDDLFDQFIEGEDIEVVIKKIFPDGGKFIFSTLLLEKRNKLVEFEKEIKDRPIIVAKVMKQVADFGLLMKYGDFTCLLPTQLATAEKEEFESLVGKELEVCPIRIDLARIRIIVSQAHAEKKKQKAARKEFISKVEVGQVYEGVVKNIEDYGAFVELYDGVEGLLHISEVDHTRVSKIEKVFKSGDTVKVQVIKVEKDHIGLSRKALLPNHWANYFADKQVGDVVTGKALEINKAGIRVQLAEELEGFVPKSEFAWDRETQIEASVNVGDEITGKLIEVEKSKRRIIVSVKQLTANPWETVQVAVGDIIDVKIAKVNEEGFKVDYQGLNGYMAKGAVKQADLEKVVLDAVVKVKVRVYDAAKQRFIVSMKDAEERVEKENYNKYIKSNDKLSNTFGDYLNDLKNKQ